MKDTLDCNIVRDMLPLYVEKLTSDESNAAIRQHLDQCKDCNEYLENIQKPIDCPTVPKMEIDYMRKAKHAFKRKSNIVAGIIIAFCIALLGIFLRFFIIGSPVSMGDSINYEWNYDADSKNYFMHGKLYWSGTSVRIKVYEDKKIIKLRLRYMSLCPRFFSQAMNFRLKYHGMGKKILFGREKIISRLLCVRNI